METLKYKVISSKKQYRSYCNVLEQLIFSGAKDRNTKDEIQLLTLLIETWDKAHNSFPDADPVELLQSLMQENDLKAKDLTEILNISKGYVSDILHYKKGLSKEVIRKLSAHFKVSQEAFNRPYELVKPQKMPVRRTGLRKKAASV